MNETKPPSLPAMIAGELAANLPTDTAINFTCDKIMPIIKKWLEKEGQTPRMSHHLSLLAAKVELETRELSSVVKSLTL